MQKGRTAISQSTIEQEIYNTFVKFKNEKNLTIAEYLKSFNASVFGQRTYRKIKFPYESLLKLVLYHRLKGFKFQTRVVKYLKKHPKEKYRLGFNKTPDQTTFSYFLNHILDNDTKEILDFTVSKIEEISEKFGILFDVKTLQPEKQIKKTKERNQRRQKNEKTREIARLFKKRFAPFINLNLKNNTLYKKIQFIDLLIHIGQTRDFAENGSQTYKEIRGYNNPDADTLLYHLKNYPDHAQIHKMFITLFEIVWEMARQANIFDIRKRYDIAIDFTEWYFYGDKSSFMVVGKEPERGTAKCYKFATINVVEAGKRFTLLALPVSALDNASKEKIVGRLLEYAMQRIKIRRIYVDRGFFDSEVIRVIEQHHLKYLMVGMQLYNVKRVMELTPSPAVVKDFLLKDVKLNLVILEEELENGKKEKRVFATNEDYDPNDVILLEKLFDLYGKRWGIESSYRVKKQSYLPKTASKNYMIRLFYFMFSVLLYNLWILADILVWLALFGVVKEDHLIASKYFGTVLYMVDPGG